MLLDHLVPRRATLSGLALAVSCLIPIGAQCQEAADTSVRESGARTIAIMGFANTSDQNTSAGFNRALQEMLTTDLAVSRDVRVVERTRLEEVLKEQRLGKTEFLDRASAARVGKGLSAEAILTGSVWIQVDEMRIDARLVHVETGEIILPATIVGKATAFLDLEKELANKIVEALGARLSAFEKASLSKRHTSNIKAATAFGQALEAEDAGNAAMAREKAAVALDFDPDFVMAKAVVSQIDTVLGDARSEDALKRAGFLASFERRLFDWPLEDSSEIVTRYRDLLKDKGPERALLYWILNQQTKTFSDGIATPYSMLFVHADQINSDSGAGHSYLNARAGDVMTFWCDVAQSDSDIAPKRRMTAEDLNPDWHTLPARGLGKPYYLWRLPDIYRKRFVSEVHCKGDIASATRIAKEYSEVCAAMGATATLYPELDNLRQQLADRDGQQRFRLKIRDSRLRWQAVEEEIVGFHIAIQNDSFRGKTAPRTAAAKNDVRAELEDELASVPGPHLPTGDPAERKRFAKRMIATLVKESEGADFVAFPFGNKADREAGSMMVHLAGCPDSLTDPRLRILYPWIERHPKPLPEAGECLGERMIPCGRCGPLRWADPVAAEKHLAAIGDRLLQEAIDTKGLDWPLGLTAILGQHLSTPALPLRNRLISLCKLTATADDPDRERQALAFRCLATVADDTDVAWLTELLSASPFFDIRANVGAVLGTIGGPKAADAIAAALQREPFYFVRHSLRASLARSLYAHWDSRRSEALRLRDASDPEEARRMLQELATEVERTSVPKSLTHRMLGALYYDLVELSRATKTPQSELLTYYRKATSFLEDGTAALAYMLNGLAYTLATDGRDLEDAERAIRKGLQIQQELRKNDPAFDDTYMVGTLALVLYKKGHLEAAKQAAMQCVARPEGQMLEIYDDLGEILWALDDQVAAKQAWTKGLSLTSDTDEDRDRAQRVREKIAR